VILFCGGLILSDLELIEEQPKRYHNVTLHTGLHVGLTMQLAQNWFQGTRDDRCLVSSTGSVRSIDICDGLCGALSSMTAPDFANSGNHREL
jgi:hypothetical protein